MPAPPVEGTPLVVYYGPDSDGVAERWEAGNRPFDLLTVGHDSSLGEVLADERVDCVVCRSDRTDEGSSDWAADGAVEDGPAFSGLNEVVAEIRDADSEVPVVAFATDVDVGAAVDLGVTHCFPASGSFDAVTHLEQLGPLVERTRRERRERSMLDSLLEHIPLSVYFKDRQSRHIKVSDTQPTLTGDYLENDEGKRHHTAADIVGKTEFGLYDMDNAAESVAVDEEIMESGEPSHDIEHIDGGPLDGTFVSTFKAPWYDGDEVVGTLGVTTDITERKQYEHQLERQNERLERFASVISHDLRNPLEVAFGRLEFARETGEEEHFDALEGALDRMNALIDDVLTLARQGETVDDPESVSLETAATDAWALVDTAGATLDVDTGARVLADPGRLQQLLENVFRNAVEHAGEDVTVTLGELDDADGFFVADDGPGIPAEDRADVFDSGFSTSDEGTGLGLSIVRTIAEAHGWDVAVTESVDGGARFEFAQVQHPD